MIAPFPRRFVLFPLALAVSAAFPATASAERLELGPSWHFLRFDRPGKLVNQGTKLTVSHIVNPETGRWELVWGDSSWNESWVRHYLQFEGKSDDVHNEGKVRILKPVTIAVVVFGDGRTEVEVDQAPAVNIRRKIGPNVNTSPDAILQPRVGGNKRAESPR